MEVTKKQIAKGVAGFIHQDMIPFVGDKGMQFVLGMVAGAVDANPQLLDKLLDGSVFAMVAKSGVNYDLGVLKQAAFSAIDMCGKLPITIPAIKFISPEEKEFQFSKEDIQKLIDRIEGR